MRRWALMVALLLYIAFAVMDVLKFPPEIYTITLVTRTIFIILPLLYLNFTYWLNPPVSIRSHVPLMLCLYLSSGFNHILIYYISQLYGFQFSELGIVLIIMFGCLLLVLPIKPAGIVTLTIIAVYTSVKIYVNNPITDLLFVLIILSFVAGICLMINLAGQKTLHQNYQLINRLYNESITDGLTKLNNKRAFQEQIERLNAIAIRDQVPLGLILVDVDYFKTVNDSFGHTIGDLVLKKVANVVDSKCRRSTDMGFRIGGDEFALILYGINVTTLEKVCLEIVKDVSVFNLKKNDKTIRTTVSVGAVLKSENANITSNNLISLADEYLYAAKGGGRNQFHTQLFNEDLRPY
ncbi:MAG: GGDEF domain-containing protein [Cognaticolwellia sp.]